MNYQLRREKLISSHEKEGIIKILIQDLDNIYYLTGFKAAVGTRPFGLLMTDKKNILIVPRVAADSAQVETQDVDISVYYEQPEGAKDGLNYYTNLVKVLTYGAPGKKIGVEFDKMSLLDGKLLNELEFQVHDISESLKQMRAVKEQEELDTVRIAGHYADFIIEKSLASIRPGISEIEIDQSGVFAVTLEVTNKLPGSSVNGFGMSLSGGERTVFPHSNSSARILQTGDSVVLCRQVAINGYRAQCDRTAFLGKAGQEQAKFSSLVLAAHEAAIDVIKPGIHTSKIDKTIRDIYEKAGVAKYFVHRSGSGLGISAAEAPYISFDSNEILQENMVIVVQPALYIPGVGGFRCSDTIIVEECGKEIITNYPRDINSLIL